MKSNVIKDERFALPNHIENKNGKFQLIVKRFALSSEVVGRTGTIYELFESRQSHSNPLVANLLS